MRVFYFIFFSKRADDSDPADTTIDTTIVISGLQKEVCSLRISIFTSVMYDGSAVFRPAVEMMVPGSCYRTAHQSLQMCAKNFNYTLKPFFCIDTNLTSPQVWISLKRTTGENCSEAMQNQYQQSWSLSTHSHQT